MEGKKLKEKKLTDEEIIKALDFCSSSPFCGSDCPYFNKHGRNFCVEDNAFYKDMKRIVLENAELQKQVDELENRFENKACCNMSENCSMVNQAVKDTAKKFADLVEFHSISHISNGVENFTISALGLKEILTEEFGFKYLELDDGVEVE